ncbi:MAG: PEP/pyruvate-binding domain-containing protein [Desulfovibrionaceae bacterium]
MIRPLARLLEAWRERRRRRRDHALDWIKARYHIFRVLLGHNEQALEGMAELDRLLTEHETARVPALARELTDTVLELVDGLNRLTDNGHAALYPRLEGLARRLDEAAARHAEAPRRAWLDLAEVRPDMRDQVGGKAQPLGGLLRAGLPVPAGVCIPRRWCREYLRRARLEDRLKALLREAAAGDADLAGLARRAGVMIAASGPDEELAGQLRAAWEHLAGGEDVAVSVRSSASAEDGTEHSFAGQFASVLGVRGPEAFVAAFKTVLASAFSARALAYRLRAGLTRQSVDMAVLCQRLVDARTSGVLFSVDPMRPAGGRMLLTAVPGLGTQAVSGRAPADVYRPARDPGAEVPADTPAEIADKTVREVPAPVGGGLVLEAVPEAERTAPLLAPEQIAALRDHALRIEALAGGPQDIEWSLDHGGRIWILQARPARLADPARPEVHPDARSEARSDAAASAVPGADDLLTGGVAAAPGKAAGRLVVVRSAADLEAAARAPRPVVLALHQSLVDAASLAPEAAALLVDMGNPLDHLGSLARELGIPMITGLGRATELAPGQWVLADADRGAVRAADPRLWRDAPRPAPRRAVPGSATAAAVRDLVLPLNLTDAYGPTFSVMECRSLHDLVRYVHEKAILALFEAGDAIAEQTFALVHRLADPTGLHFLIIDLGGGLAPGAGAEVGREEILCEPLAALCQGMSAPGLRWGAPPPIPGVGGLVSRTMLDAASARPVGEPNYALVARDYLNLNARVDFHFALVDAVCGANPRENSIRFRFKGGGVARVQRERRAVFVEQVLRRRDFFTTRQGDMVTGVFTEGPRQAILDRLDMLGRFLGFSRLLDAAMVDDDMPGRMAEAFLTGDYTLEQLMQALAAEGRLGEPDPQA